MKNIAYLFYYWYSQDLISHFPINLQLLLFIYKYLLAIKQVDSKLRLLVYLKYDFLESLSIIFIC